jgi:ubiquinone biosynthesis accessory factor UbiJ
MSFAMFQSALLLPLELAINGVLALDAASTQRLAKLDGGVLAVHSTQPTMSVYLKVQGNRVHLSAMHEGNATASLHGSAKALAGLLLRRGATESLHSTTVELRGDTAFVQQLQSLLRDLDIDWEYHLSKVIGDIPTQAAADSMRKAGAELRRTGERLRENVSEYLHEEAGILARADELETFYNDIADLKLRAERLQARIDQLSMKSR